VPTHDHPSRRRPSRAWIMGGGKMCFRGSTMTDHSVYVVHSAASNCAGSALWSQVSTWRHGGGCARPRATTRSLAGPRSAQGAWLARTLYSAEGEAQGGGDGRGLKRGGVLWRHTRRHRWGTSTRGWGDPGWPVSQLRGRQTRVASQPIVPCQAVAGSPGGDRPGHLSRAAFAHSGPLDDAGIIGRYVCVCACCPASNVGMIPNSKENPRNRRTTKRGRRRLCNAAMHT
jgi:hypothetical protein